MEAALLKKFKEQISLSTPKGEVLFSHPSSEDLPTIIDILQDEDLDLRGLCPTADLTYSVADKESVLRLWREEITNYQQHFPDDPATLKDIKAQIQALMDFMKCPDKGTVVVDPFCMKDVEKNLEISWSASRQLKNTIIGKASGQIVTMGRLLEVGDAVEMVDLWTRADFRRMGLAKKIIELRITNSTRQPLFSFEKPSLVHFYLSEYRKLRSANIATFSNLPKQLQSDLYYMNIFWGPYTIIEINS